MRKRKKGKKFSREKDQRKALIKGLVAEFFLREKIKTTEAKAKTLKKFAEKFLSRARKGDLAARRYLTRFFSKKITKKLVNEISPRFKGRKGGYTRIVKLGPRKSDGTKMAIIELLK
ncbi:50S ribosomal protein L17 [Patescibacteria group bacterium]|nr:50S ribosomal protein L17 [Patescibacteria group bacterium]